ncbi:MAG: disulfide oxidoreductase [Candidatus Cloacimonadota bacterium]|nr:MAG: disulfide oxidoreductase [Candidatus Cloacimonadota bacterium]PIE80824.1 MAG: disulfide oxidoreductase [Candidatus Delongbacteria bacterium]
MKITKEMSITEIIKTYPETASVFQSFNLGCIGCIAASFETLEDGLNAHQLDVEEVLRELNKVVG